MTEKLLTFPSPTSQDLVDGVNRSKFNFFPEQYQHKPTKTFVPGQHVRIQELFCQGEMGSGSSTFFTVYRGGPMVLLHIFQGVVQLFPGGGGGGGVQMLISIETHVTITCDFPGVVWTPYPPSGSANVQCGILARIGSEEPVRPPFKLRNSKC